MGIDVLEPVIFYEDNQSTIHCLNKWEQKRLKHVDVHYHFAKDLYDKKEIEVLYIPSIYQRADILTKPLCEVEFERKCSLLGVSLFNC
jgi:hypothetical protein